MSTRWAVADATKRGRVAPAPSGAQRATAEISPPGVPGQVPHLARANAWLENM
jgi:hypothetical protein